MAPRGRPRNSKLPVRPCKGCGEDYQPSRPEQKYHDELCSLAVGRLRYSEKQQSYTRKKNYLGYWQIKVDGSWVPEGRHVYEQAHGLKLPSTVYVGYRDGNKDNLSPENLYLKNKLLDEAVQKTGKLPKLVNGRPPKIKRTQVRKTAP